MLAQNFKTPVELGRTGDEFDALLKVLGMLERGDIVHDRRESFSQNEGFNMSIVQVKHDCGTAACIYGWARSIHPSFRVPDGDVNLFELFSAMGRSIPVKLDDITVPQASIALRNYLTHGEARWDEALAG